MDRGRVPEGGCGNGDVTPGSVSRSEGWRLRGDCDGEGGQ